MCVWRGGVVASVREASRASRRTAGFPAAQRAPQAAALPAPARPGPAGAGQEGGERGALGLPGTGGVEGAGGAHRDAASRPPLHWRAVKGVSGGRLAVGCCPGRRRCAGRRPEEGAGTSSCDCPAAPLALR